MEWHKNIENKINLRQHQHVKNGYSYYFVPDFRAYSTNSFKNNLNKFVFGVFTATYKIPHQTAPWQPQGSELVGKQVLYLSLGKKLHLSDAESLESCDTRSDPDSLGNHSSEACVLTSLLCLVSFQGSSSTLLPAQMNIWCSSSSWAFWWVWPFVPRSL